MKRRIFGLENEYGLTCTLNGQRRLSPDNVARYLFEKVIPGARNANVFLENGARLYLDTGFHPEYATLYNSYYNAIGRQHPLNTSTAAAYVLLPLGGDPSIVFPAEARWVGVAQSASMVPNFLLILVGGALADRVVNRSPRGTSARSTSPRRGTTCTW